MHLSLFLVLAFFSNSSGTVPGSNVSPPTSIAVAPCDVTPALNAEVMVFVTSKMRKRVGRGECWDLAAEALDKVDASWDHRYRFGRQVDPENDCIYPGDMIQFKNVKLVYYKNGNKYTENMKHHTAVVYEVLGPGHFKIAHQNTNFSGRRVGISSFNMADMIKGKIWVYRPEK